MIIYDPIISGSVEGAVYNADVVTTSFTGSSNRLYALSSSAAITASLPSSPESGDSVKLSNVTLLSHLIDVNGNNFMGQSEDVTLDTTTSHFELIYTNSTTGWVIIA